MQKKKKKNFTLPTRFKTEIRAHRIISRTLPGRLFWSLCLFGIQKYSFAWLVDSISHANSLDDVITQREEILKKTFFNCIFDQIQNKNDSIFTII